ncbi:TRAP transporter substrate-binding protein [Neobacillus mesonae]|uniref:TRAP transporter substrate-binding protein n=1 Tax=Neobacillus mesonae TaxID=1193713 RepID=UPI00203B4FD1|nr:TRAP transporter substrate-binding protein [Neobacillus mesonae]MCM3566943.1 TRAP transporter substrate-binding protein [Neobacillus mesonae]
MVKKLSLLLISLVVIIMAGCSSDKSSGSDNKKETFTLKLGHVGPADAEHPWQKYAKIYADEIEKKTDGRVKIQIYPSSQLGGDREMTEALQQGTLEMGLISTIAMGNFVPELQVWDLPYIFPNDNAKVDEILEGPIGEKLANAMSKKSLHALAYWENDWRAMTNSKHPIESVKDLKGLKMRVVENKPSLDWFGRVGAIPTPMAFSEVYTALQQKTIDGQDNGTLLTHGAKLYEVQPYFTFTNHMYAPLALVVSDKTWSKMPEDIQKILKETGVTVGKEQRKYSRETAKKLAEQLKKEGVTVTELSDSAIKEFQDSAAETYKKLAPEIGQDLIDEMLKYRQ